MDQQIVEYTDFQASFVQGIECLTMGGKKEKTQVIEEGRTVVSHFIMSKGRSIKSDNRLNGGHGSTCDQRNGWRDGHGLAE